MNPAPASPASAIEPGDPAHALLTAVEAMTRQSQRELGVLVSKLAGDIAASSVLAEQAAKAKAEAVITQAGEWAAQRIRDAGHDAAVVWLAERQIAHDETYRLRTGLRRLAITIFASNTVLTLLLTLLALLAYWRLP